jgi:1,4-alpha-glucan branching enzyme
VDEATTPLTEGGSCDWQGTGVCLYLPSRSAQVYKLTDQRDLTPEEQWSTTRPDDDYFSWEEEGTGGGGDDAVWY